jgi:hypothetical protein
LEKASPAAFPEFMSARPGYCLLAMGDAVISTGNASKTTV